MPFPGALRNLCLRCRNTKKYKDTPPRTMRKHWCPDPRFREKVSAVSSFCASLTVEAACVVPLFLLCISFFWTFFPALGIQIRIQYSLDELTGELAQQSFLLEKFDSKEEDAFDESLDIRRMLKGTAWIMYETGRLVKTVGRETLQASPIEKGAAGLSLLASSWHRKGDICLVVRYRLIFRGFPGLVLKLPVELASRRRCWSGQEPLGSGNSDDSGEMVYVTESGQVYHRDGSCYHLRVTVRTVSAGAVKAARNQSGGRYTPCEHCAVSAVPSGTVFITPQGDRYHVSRDCSGLKRTVSLVPLESISLPPCSHCGEE